MLRISETKNNKNSRFLVLEGRVCQPWLDELRLEIDKSVNNGQKLVLDFSKVTFMDEEGARLVSQPPYHDVEKRNCSLFIRTMLHLEGGGVK